MSSLATAPASDDQMNMATRALHLVSSGKLRCLTEIAHTCGYFDQAHFNHEFREFAGMSPGELATFPNVAF
jgi:AraC-like DNA-binding protein